MEQNEKRCHELVELLEMLDGINDTLERAAFNLKSYEEVVKEGSPEYEAYNRKAVYLDADEILFRLRDLGIVKGWLNGELEQLQG